MKRFRCFLVVAGLAMLVGCQSGAPPVTPPNPPPVSGPAVIPETTKVADAATRDALVSFDPVTGILIFAAETPVLSSLSVGDVFASDVIGDKAAWGFLLKVTAKRSENGRVILETRPALLEEAVQTGRLVIEQTLSPEDEVTILAEGVEVRDLEPSELSTQASKTFAKEFNFDNSVLEFKSANGSTVKVAFDGSIKLGATVAGDIDIGFFDINSFYAQVTVSEEAKLKVSAEASLTGTARKDIAKLTLGTVSFYIGPVPVVVDADLIISIGADGKVAARVVTEATQNLSATVGIKYDEDDGWSPINKFDSSFDFKVDAEAEFEARAYVGARVGLYLYGVVGAGFETKAFVRTIVKIPNDPFWVLEGGVDLSAYFEGEFPFIGLQRYEKKLGEFKKEIGRSENQAPELNLSSLPPEIDQNVAVRLKVEVKDKEGNCCKSVVWTSDRDGPLGEGVTLDYTFKTTGSRTLTVTATDDGGKTSSRTATVSVVNAPPELSVSYSRFVKATQAHAFVVRPIDLNEKIDCSAIVWDAPAGVALVEKGCEALATYPSAGSSSINISVTDGEGASATKTETFNVGAAPENSITISEFQPGLFNPGPTEVALKQGDSVERFGDIPLYVKAAAFDSLGRGLTYEFFVTFSDGDDDRVAGKTYTLYKTSQNASERSISVYNISLYAPIIAAGNLSGSGSGFSTTLQGTNPAVLGVRVTDENNNENVRQIDIVIIGVGG